jgi:hypothetical protein
MKQIKLILALGLLLITANLSYGQMSDWKQQKDFHAVMSKTFHPAEEGNYQPIKTRSAELAAKADAWKNSAMPETIQNKKEVKKTLKKLSKDAGKLDRKIKNGVSDEVLKTDLIGLHDTFHTLVGLCNAKEDHNH